MKSLFTQTDRAGVKHDFTRATSENCGNATRRKHYASIFCILFAGLLSLLTVQPAKAQYQAFYSLYDAYHNYVVFYYAVSETDPTFAGAMVSGYLAGGIKNEMEHRTYPETVSGSGTGSNGYEYSYTNVPVTIIGYSGGNENIEGAVPLRSATIPSQVVEIGAHVFEGRVNLTDIYFPQGLQQIGNAAFNECSSLVTTIPDNVKFIGNAAFNGCSSLTSINIPLNCTSLGVNAFSSCSNLNTVYYNAKNVSLLGSTQVFGYCPALQNLITGNEAEVIPPIFANTALRNISLSSSVKKIESSAFQQCADLTNINFSEGLEEINTAAFMGCTSLAEVLLPNTLETMGINAFRDCSAITDVYIPASLSVWRTNDWGYNNAFSGCTSLKNVDIHSASIGARAFYGCTGLQQVRVYWETPIDIRWDEVFYGVNTANVTLIVPRGTKALYQAADVWKNFHIIEDDSPSTDQTDVETAQGLIESMTDVSVAQATANTEADVKIWLAGQINALAGMSATGITVSAADITVSGFSAATIGNADNPSGTNGGFAFTVSLQKGSSTAITTASKSGIITATHYTSTTTYQVNIVPAVNGAVSANKTTATAGETVTLTIAPATGYELDAITTTPSVTLSGTGNTRSFSMPAYDVTVNATFKKTVVSVTGVELDKTSVTLNINDTEQLTATVYPADAANKNVSWSSSNVTIATITTNGLITAVGEGTATITVATQDGHFTANCLVVVSKLTGLPDISAEIKAYISGNILYVNSPVGEIISLYSVSGSLLYSTKKPAGEIQIPLNSIRDKVLIVRSGSGWVIKGVKN